MHLRENGIEWIVRVLKKLFSKIYKRTFAEWLTLYTIFSIHFTNKVHYFRVLRFRIQDTHQPLTNIPTFVWPSLDCVILLHRYIWNPSRIYSWHWPSVYGYLLSQHIFNQLEISMIILSVTFGSSPSLPAIPMMYLKVLSGINEKYPFNFRRPKI